MSLVTCTCGKKFQLGDEYAGRRVKCRSCGASFAVPASPPVVVLAMPPEVESSGDRATAIDTEAGVPACNCDNACPQADPGCEETESHHGPLSGSQPTLDYPASKRQTIDGRTAPSEQDHGIYQILRPHAKGGMGQVSVAEDTPLHREVALKELLDATAADPACRQRFLEEAEITGQLEHPGVVPVYALGLDKAGRPFYTMRLVRGKTLKDAIQEHHASPTPAGFRELLRRFVMVCQTVAYAHHRGVIHRDLKPTNIMLGQYGETLVMDWGLAKPVKAGDSEDSTVGDLAQSHLSDRPEATAPGGIVGTPAFMSPEQAFGKSEEIGPASDVFSLGAILYQILAGKPAYSGASAAEVIEKVRSSAPPRPSAIAPRVPRPLEAVCLKAMAREPGDRYGKAAELGEEVQSWLDDEPVSAYPEPMWERAWRWARRHKAASLASLAVLLLTLAGGSLTVVLVERERARAEAAEQVAEEYARQAEAANRLADAKEQEAQRLSEQAETARREAAAARQIVAAAQGDVTAAQARLAESQNNAMRLAQEADALRDEAKQLRMMASRFTALANGEPLPAELTAAMPGDEIDWSVLPPKSGIPLSSLQPTKATVGYGAYQTLPVDKAIAPFDKTFAPFAGRECRDLLVTHAPSDVRFAIPPGATRFTALGAAEEEWSEYEGTWKYRVYVDDKLAFESRLLMSYPRRCVMIDVKLPPDAKELRLETDSWGNGGADWSLWGWPSFHVPPGLAAPRPSSAEADGPDPPIAKDLLARGARVFVASGQRLISVPRQPDNPWWAMQHYEGTFTLEQDDALPPPPYSIVIVVLADAPTPELVAPWSRLKSLQTLTLRRFKADPVVAEALAKIESLRALSLFESGCTDDDFQCLGVVRQLEWLSVQRTAVGDRSMPLIAGLSRLKYLNLTDTPVSDSGLAPLRSLKQLETLHMGGIPTNITGRDLSVLATLPTLKELSVGFCPDLDTEAIGSLPNLVTLFVAHSGCTSEGISAFGSLSKLRTLSLVNTRIDDRAVEHLLRLKALELVDLAATKVSAAGVVRLRQGLPKCTVHVDAAVEEQIKGTQDR